jgi:hypothetical protein
MAVSSYHIKAKFMFASTSIVFQCRIVFDYSRYTNRSIAFAAVTETFLQDLERRIPQNSEIIKMHLYQEQGQLWLYIPGVL